MGLLNAITSIFSGSANQSANPPVAAQQVPAEPSVSITGQSAKATVSSALTPPWTLEEMCAEIMRNEGGFVNDPADPGGATKYGISLRFLHSIHYGEQGGRSPATVDTVSHLLPAEAQAIYVEYFYKAAHLDELPNVLNVVMQLFDICVNTGQGESIKILQHALGVPADGVLGPTTVSTAISVALRKGAKVLNNAITDARVAFYTELVASHPADARFLKGWEDRANKYRV